MSPFMYHPQKIQLFSGTILQAMRVGIKPAHYVVRHIQQQDHYPYRIDIVKYLSISKDSNVVKILLSFIIHYIHVISIVEDPNMKYHETIQ